MLTRTKKATWALGDLEKMMDLWPIKEKREKKGPIPRYVISMKKDLKRKNAWWTEKDARPAYKKKTVEVFVGSYLANPIQSIDVDGMR